MPQATSKRATGGNADVLATIQVSLQSIVRALGQARTHERLLERAGVRLDRAGTALLYKLSLHGDEPLRVSALADLLGVDAPTVTRKAQQLEHLGYVTRDPDPEDGRATRVHLTPEGRTVLSRVVDAHRDLLAGVVAGWDDQERRTFAGLLERFAASLQTTTEDHRDQ
ncbi:MAG: MarR family winged helix-turn-helix transcriptional regulator [Acidimicrobiales bacterium]